MTEFSAVGSFVISSSMILSFEQKLRRLVAGVDVQFAAGGMHPQAVAFERQRDGIGAVDDGERIVLYAVAQFADMDVGVTLRAPFQAVDREAPPVAPEFVGFGDGKGSNMRCAVRESCPPCLADCVRESAAGRASGSAYSDSRRAAGKTRARRVGLRRLCTASIRARSTSPGARYRRDSSGRRRRLGRGEAASHGKMRIPFDYTRGKSRGCARKRGVHAPAWFDEKSCEPERRIGV